MAKITILIGNMGSGKTTFVKKLNKKEVVVLSKDDLRYAIGAGKYIFNPKYEQAIDLAIITLVIEFMKTGVDIIIDETNTDKKTRKAYLILADIYRYFAEAIIMPKLTMVDSVNRRLKNNHGDTPRKVWEEVFRRKRISYEIPTKKEGFDNIIKL